MYSVMNQSGSLETATRYHRRDAVRAGGLGLFGLTLPKLLQAEAVTRRPAPVARARSVIFLFQWGGPSHVDMFDRKTQAPDGYRSKYDWIGTSVPGMQVCEHLPETSRVMHRIAQIRTVHHTMNNHNAAGYTALTGVEPPVDDQRLRDSIDLFPAVGSVVDAVAPNTNGMPTFVSYPHTIADGSKTPGQGASFLGKLHDPLFIPNDPNSPDFRLPQLSLPAGVSPGRLADRRSLQRLINRQAKSLDESAAARGISAYYDKALGMLSSPRVRNAFDLSEEPAGLRDSYGRTTYGQGCLLARRLVETGVKFVTVYFDRSIGGRSKTGGGWDTHGFDGSRMFEILPARHLPITDHTLPTLLNDLEDRGLLERTFVFWLTDFGRTPIINSAAGRDHWSTAGLACFAGAGVQGGQVIGRTDETGARPVGEEIFPEQIAATVYEKLGLPPDMHHTAQDGRPIRLCIGDAIPELG